MARAEERGFPYPARAFEHARSAYRNQDEFPRSKRSKAPTAYSPSVWLLLREDARIGRIRLKVRGLEVMASTVTEMEVDQAIALLAREYWVFGITGSGSFGIMELQLKS